MKNPEVYQVLVSLPIKYREKLHNVKARRQLAGRTSQSIASIASEILAEGIEETEKTS